MMLNQFAARYRLQFLNSIHLKKIISHVSRNESEYADSLIDAKYENISVTFSFAWVGSESIFLSKKS